MNLSPQVNFLLDELVDHNELRHLPIILKDFTKYVYEVESIYPVTVISADKLNQDQMDKISEQVKGYVPKGKNLSISNQIDTSVIAGFRLVFGTSYQVLDLTARDRIAKLEQLLKNTLA